MGHASPEVQATADAIAPSLVDDGVLAVISAILAASIAEPTATALE